MTERMRIVIGTTLWRRHDVERLTLDVVREAVEPDADIFDVELVCVGSEGDASRAVAHAAGWHYEEHANKPLTKKHNAMASVAREFEADVLIVMGSDDWVSAGFLRAFRDAGMLGAPGVNIFGLEDLYFADTGSNRVLHWPGYRALGNMSRARHPIGAFCGITREALDAVRWRPWPGELNQGLDRAMQENLHSSGVRGVKMMTMREAGVCAVDWKSDTNIWKFSKFAELPGVLHVSTEDSLQPWFSDTILEQMRQTGRGKKTNMEGHINHTDKTRPLAGVDVRALRRDSLKRVAPELFDAERPRVKRALYIGANHRRHDFLADVCRVAEHVDIVEAFRPNVESVRAALIPKMKKEHGTELEVIHADIVKHELAHTYDLVVWWHGPEHVGLDALPRVLAALEATGGMVILGCPWGHYQQGAVAGNTHEAHLSALEPDYFAARGYNCDVVGKRGAGSNIAAVRRADAAVPAGESTAEPDAPPEPDDAPSGTEDAPAGSDDPAQGDEYAPLGSEDAQPGAEDAQPGAEDAPEDTPLDDSPLDEETMLDDLPPPGGTEGL